MITRFKQFIDEFTSDDRVAVVSHVDTDGLCSGYIAKKALERLGHKPVLKLEISALAINSELVKELKAKKVTKTVFTDLTPDQFPQIVAELASFSGILVLDHHKLYHDIQTEKVTTIKTNPHMGITKYYPSSKQVYDLFSEVVDIKDLDWVAAVGLVGDTGYRQSKKFVDQVMRKYNIFPAEDLFKTDIGKAANYLNSASTIIPKKIKLALRVLEKAKKPQDIVNSSLAKISGKVEQEIKKQTEHFKKTASVNGDLLIGEIDSKYAVKGAIATRLSLLEMPEKTLIITQKVGDYYVVSARRNDGKVALNDLLEYAVKGFKDAGFGGHKPAAGGMIKVEDFPAFKKKLIEQHEKIRASN